MKNLGQGHFAESGHFSSPRGVPDILVGDFNNDGKRDVVTPNYGFFGEGNTISLFINQGNATFSQPVDYSSGNRPAGVAAADLNNDGWLDLVVSNYVFGPSTVSIFFNNGNGTFAPRITFPAGESAWRLAAGDMNGDSFIDIVVGNGGRKVNVLYNSNGNNFSNRIQYEIVPGPTAGADMSSVAIGDINNDGRPEIFYSPGLRFEGLYDHLSIGLLRNLGNGNFATAEFIEMVPFTGTAPAIEISDLNLDGWKDMTLASYNGRASDGYMVFMNNGSGGFQPPYLNPAGQYTVDVMSGDADNDGKIDILTTDESSLMVTFHRNFGNAYFPTPGLYPTNSFIASFLDAADIDDDGDLDVLTSATGAAGGESKPSLLKNLGSGRFTPGVNYSIRNGGVQAKLRDINGDRKPDIIFATAATSPPYDFHYALNNGDGTFGAVQTKSINACGWFDINAADFIMTGIWTLSLAKINPV